MKNIGTFKTYSFGCRVNQAEETEIQKKMFEAGFNWQKKNPNVIIINTCAVTNKAEREAKQFIYQVKRQLPKTFLVAVGCAVTNWQKSTPKNKLPVDLAVPNLNKNYLVELILKRYNSQLSKTVNKQKLSLPNKYFESGRYLLKIQDGCHRFCSYCIVPYLRGQPKSAPIPEIVKTVNNLPQNIKEVILTAVNTESYGFDTGENFIDLIQLILKQTKIERLSLGSINPWSVNSQFLSFYQKEVKKRNRESGRFLDFFHIPLQSGSDKILKLMKRGYNKKEFAEKLAAIKEINPQAFIGTDIIAGFLGETDDDFKETYQFLKQSPIDKFHVFRFSCKKDTAAYYLAEKLKQPDEKTKRLRSQLLIKLSREKYQKFQEKLLAKTFSCLLLPQRKEGRQLGLLSNQAPVWIAAKRKLPNVVKTIQVVDFKKDSLYGKILSSSFN